MRAPRGPAGFRSHFSLILINPERTRGRARNGIKAWVERLIVNSVEDLGFRGTCFYHNSWFSITKQHGLAFLMTCRWPHLSTRAVWYQTSKLHYSIGGPLFLSSPDQRDFADPVLQNEGYREDGDVVLIKAREYRLQLGPCTRFRKDHLYKQMLPVRSQFCWISEKEEFCGL